MATKGIEKEKKTLKKKATVRAVRLRNVFCFETKKNRALSVGARGRGRMVLGEGCVAHQI